MHYDHLEGSLDEKEFNIEVYFALGEAVWVE